jgi:uncharacterized protein YecT (DUF1311 family)
MHAAAIRLSMLLLTFSAASPVFAENCQNAQTTIEMNACAGENYKAADRDLNRAFARAISAAKESDRNVQGVDDSYEQALREAQRAWIAFRDADCKPAPRELAGSISTMEQLDCLTEKTVQRTKELRQRARE